MPPGVLSGKGFLGVNESLESVLTEDTSCLARLRVTHVEIANNIETVLSIVMGRRREDLKDWLRRITPFPKLAEPQGIPQFTMYNLPDTA